jgi:hypothetical protein
MQNDTTSFITYAPVPPASNDENSTKANQPKEGDQAGTGMEREAAQLFHSLWLAMKEQRVLAVGMYKGQAGFRPHPVALVVQEEEYADSGEQVHCPIWTTSISKRWGGGSYIRVHTAYMHNPQACLYFHSPCRKGKGCWARQRCGRVQDRQAGCAWLASGENVPPRFPGR